MKITRTDRLGFDGVKILIYGGAGYGKTCLCATAPSPLILSAESGLLSLRKKAIPCSEIKTLDDLHEAHDWILTSKDSQYFKTICLDSLSEMADIVLQDAKQGKKDMRQAYGELIDEMMIIIKKFRDLKDKHVCFTARETIDDNGMMQPDLPGAVLGPRLPYYFDEVFHINLVRKGDKTKRYLLTETDHASIAKDRSGSLNVFEKMDLSEVIGKIAKG